jgi:DNA polymerase
MTADEKTNLARFLDLAAASSGHGYLLRESEYGFEDDEEEGIRGKKGIRDQGLGIRERCSNDDTASGLYPDSPNNDPRSPIPSPRSPISPHPLLPTPYSPSSEDSLEKIAEDIKVCTLCRLCETRTNAVPGEGVSNPVVMVIGEGPGADEDASGRPFVGNAGKLLDKMLSAIGLSRESNCFIANVIKCRPPANRDPLPDETAFCAPFLERQIRLLQPRFILCAGRISAQTLLHTPEPVGRIRGKFTKLETGGMETPLIATYHPAALIRNEDLKRPAWEDLKTLRAAIDG